MIKLNQTQTAIIKTLCYANIFEFPLRKAEIHRYLIYKEPIAKVDLNISIRMLKKSNLIREKSGYFFLSKHAIDVQKRLQRKIFSQPKQKIAHKIGKCLKIIPWIKAVAITGALAMENSVQNDDIDLMIITSRNRLWVTRILVVLLVSLMVNRRKPIRQFDNLKTCLPAPKCSAGKQFKQWNNCICLNLFLDEIALQIPKNKRNLYTAHEVAQTKFLWSRDDMNKQFLSQNLWITNYLPNVVNKKSLPFIKRSYGLIYKKTIQQLNTGTIFDRIEQLAYKAQLFYMKPKMTAERVSLHFAFFHPRDTAAMVVKKYNSILQRYKALQMVN